MTTTRKRVTSPHIRRPLTLAEAEDALQRVYQSDAEVSINVPVEALPLLAGCLAGALDCPDVPASRLPAIRRLLFQVAAQLDSIAPGLVEVLLSESIEANDATAVHDAMTGCISDVEADCFQWATTGRTDE